MDTAVGKFSSVDIWINNAGVNQPMVPSNRIVKKRL